MSCQKQSSRSLSGEKLILQEWRRYACNVAPMQNKEGVNGQSMLRKALRDAGLFFGEVWGQGKIFICRKKYPISNQRDLTK